MFDQVEKVCQLAEQYEADVLLVAGDVFARRTLPGLTKRLAGILAPRVRYGMHVILVPGNHDDREHFRMMHALLALEQGQSERVHIVQTREILLIEGVQFAVVPYPTRELLEPYRSEITGATQRNVALSGAYANLVRAVVGELDPSLPAVFVTHVNVAGVKTPSERELSYDEDLRLGRSDLPLANLAYIALGHIHQPQPISHQVPCHYSGSIDRLNMGERKDDKCVLLVDVPQTGPAEVTPLPLETTPFYDFRLSAEELENLPNSCPETRHAFVRIHLELRVGDDPVALQRRVQELCPRCLGVQFSGEGLSRIAADSPAQPKDYAATALDYLRQIYSEDPDLPELEKRASELLREVEDAPATN
jgi:DNA repair exonuclease SbcCD nuclease subunit